ncbi:MAG: DUF3179 domain-containing protein [Cyclobacteriaceae bacterium]
MKSNKLLTILAGISFLLYGCGDEVDDTPGPATGSPSANSPGAWSVPIGQVIDGGPGKDGIPALENPKFVDPNEIDYLLDDELVVGYKFNDVVRAYPHNIFNWHEIVNDDIGGHKMAITHCPLTGTSVGWERVFDGHATTFGVSGLLYNTNLMPYDRESNSTWTQQGLKCVNGPLKGTSPETFQIFETTWATWKIMYPDTKVISRDTGYDRFYESYPYANYRSSDGLIFSVSVNDNRLHKKERVHGVIIRGGAKVYRFQSFENTPIIYDTFKNENIVVIGSVEKNFIISFKEKTINDTVLEFTAINDFESADILKDQLGNTWDVFGNATTGPNVGEKLVATESFIGMFFSWAPFYGLPEIYLE